MGVTQVLAEEIAATRYDDIPPAARQQAKRLLIDHVGIAYMGFQFTGRALADYAKDVGGTPEAVIIGDGGRVTAELAAGVNAQYCRNTDFEETGPGLHAGPVMAHTAFAVGQRVGASGQDVLAATALGYELNGRFFYARRDNDIRHWALCAAAVAARLLDLSPQAINRALSIAWELPTKSLLFQLPKIAKRVSRLGSGNLWLGRHGVQAGLMAAHGFDQLSDEIDVLGSEYQLSALVRSPSPYHYTATELMLKPWPSSRLCHGALQMLERIVAEERIAPEEITRVRLHLADLYTIPHQFDPAPDEYWQAIYSVQWGTAMALLRLPPGPAWYTTERLRDPVSRALAQKIELVEDPEASAALRTKRWLDIPNTVELHARGRVFRDRIVFHDVLGSPRNPMPEPMLEAKFKRLAGAVIGEPKAAALFASLAQFERLANVNGAAELM
ncbi:MAG: MmgE/PrpD family protein [Alphaproteobacteria bacterium]|nr:MmgE/PrpD family protein [Alphaproteobacteria bacterium]